MNRVRITEAFGLAGSGLVRFHCSWIGALKCVCLGGKSELLGGSWVRPIGHCFDDDWAMSCA